MLKKIGYFLLVGGVDIILLWLSIAVFNIALAGVAALIVGALCIEIGIGLLVDF